MRLAWISPNTTAIRPLPIGGTGWRYLPSGWKSATRINDYYAYLPYFLNSPDFTTGIWGATTASVQRSDFHIIFSGDGKGHHCDIWIRCRDVASRVPVRNHRGGARVNPRMVIWRLRVRVSIWNYFTGQYGSASDNDGSLWEIHAFVRIRRRSAYPVIPVDSW